MSGPWVLVSLLVSAVAVAVASGHRAPPSADRAVAAAREHARRGVGAGFAVGAVAAVGVALTGSDELGVTALLVPTAFGAGLLVALLLTELTWPRPDGAVRRAELTHRGPLDAVPAWLLRTTAGVLTGSALVLVGGTLLADGSGRALTVVVGPLGSSASPFPGSTFALPAALGLVVVWALALAALRVVAERPAVTLDDPDTETALRRASAHRVVRTATGTTAIVAGGLLAVGGQAVWSVEATTGGWPLVGVLAAGVGLVAASGGVVLLLLTGPRLPAPSAPSPLR